MRWGDVLWQEDILTPTSLGTPTIIIIHPARPPGDLLLIILRTDDFIRMHTRTSGLMLVTLERRRLEDTLIVIPSRGIIPRR